MTLLTEKTEKNAPLCNDCVVREECNIKDNISEGYVVNYCTNCTTEEDLKKWEEVDLC